MIRFYCMKRCKMRPRITCSKKYKGLPCRRGSCAPSGQEIMRRPAWKNKTLLRAASRHKPPAHLINCAVNWIPRVCGQTQTTREHVAEQEQPTSPALFIKYLRNEDAMCLQQAWPGDKRTVWEKHLGQFAFLFNQSVLHVPWAGAASSEASQPGAPDCP